MQEFQLVEGRVFQVAKRRSRTCLNFAEDWKSDFTISVKGKARSLFKRAGLKLASLEGKRIRVRGWLREWNGPFI